MKTLVTGGKGFIGSYVVEELAKGGNEVIIYDHVQDSIGLKGLRDLSSERLRTIEADILDDDALLKIISTERPDCVVHLAAITGIKRCLDAKRQSFEVNVYGTYNIASASANVNSKLVFVSSREVYGESAGKSTPENTPLLPNNVYGLTKMLAEKLVRHFGQKHRLRYTILRLTNVYGPGGDKYGLQIIVKKALRDEKIEIMGGSQVMNFLYVKDAARAIAMCVSNRKSDGETFNVGSFDQLSINEAVERLSNLLKKDLDIQHVPFRETETTFFKPDLSKIMNVLGWTPKVNFDQGLQSTVEYYRQKLASML